jgi:hypothetical protein
MARLCRAIKNRFLIKLQNPKGLPLNQKKRRSRFFDLKAH